MKRILAILLATVFCLSFAACTLTPEKTSVPETTTEPAPTTTAAPENAPELIDVTDSADLPEFSFMVNEEVIDNASMKDATVWQVKDFAVLDAKGQETKYTFAGYAIRDILAAAKCKGVKSITITASDAFELTYDITDVNAPYCIIAIAENTEEEGSVIFAPTLENTSNFFVKSVVKIVTE